MAAIHLEGKQFTLLLPAHIEEIISILDSFSRSQIQGVVNSSNDLLIKKTSKGLILSRGVVPGGESYYINYAVSHEKLVLKNYLICSIKRLILATVNRSADEKLIKGDHRVFHLLLKK